MMWLLIGLICAILFLGLVKLRNMYLVPFCPEKATWEVEQRYTHISRTIKLKAIKLTEAVICAMVLIVVGPLSTIALAIYLGYVIYELILAVYYWLRINKPDLFTREF